MYIPTNEQKDAMQLAGRECAFELSPYPFDILPAHSKSVLDAAGIPYAGNQTRYHPTINAQDALVHWNCYLAANEEYHRKEFLTRALWLVDHEEHIGNDAGGWPISVPHPEFHAEGRWL